MLSSNITFMANYLQLPISFDLHLLQKDVATALQIDWKSHFNTDHYNGTWDVVSLRSLGGRTQNILPLAAQEQGYQNTPLLEKCSYFKSIIDSFECNIEAVRLLRLAPDSIIKEHIDAKLGYEFGDFRWHIPIQSNSKAIFYSCGEPFHMSVGELWYLNASQPHAVENLGDNDRIHLIIDGNRNEWTDNLFEKAGYDFQKEKTNRQTQKKPQIEQMIIQFEAQGTPVMVQLAEEWKEKLATGDY